VALLIIQAGEANPNTSALHISPDLAAEIEEDERMFGGGASAALKSLKVGT
jgi:hypothetical protein